VNEHEHDSDLRTQAQRLGARAAERLDVERTAAAVLRRLREEPVARPAWWARPSVLRIAAAMVVIVGSGVLYRTVHRPAVPASLWVSSTDEEGNDLSSDQLRALLQTIDQDSVVEMTPASAQDTGLEDLDSAQLRELLRSLEG
jgi:hypothetical protein